MAKLKKTGIAAAKQREPDEGRLGGSLALPSVAKGAVGRRKKQAGDDVWSKRARREDEAGKLMDEFELPERRLDEKRWGRNPVEGEA